MRNKECKVINIGDTFMIDSRNFGYYSATTNMADMMFEGEVAKFGLGRLYNDLPYDELGKVWNEMLFAVKYLGNGRVQEVSTGKVFPIYLYSEDYKLSDGIYGMPSGVLLAENTAENVLNIEKADKFLSEADRFPMAVVLYRDFETYTDKEFNKDNFESIDQYQHYDNEQRNDTLVSLERNAIRFWDNDRKDFVDFLETMKKEGYKNTKN